ncbi:MAG: cytochrome c biogenesis protein CcsA [Deltaproteobacteria bacterium]|nr:cytochrome c biogenesis protein CcsA [Deltaproteobacteria bacterium]MBI3386439.1 cytochrome c biogenesis protein CcsA [Deltaproteobacteria bacterium]
MELLLLILALVLYLAATVGFVTHLLSGRDLVRRLALAALAGAFVVDALAITARSIVSGALAVTSFHDQLSLFACLIVGMYLWMQRRYPLTVLGSLISPLAFLFVLSAYVFYSGNREFPRDMHNLWLPAHIAPAFLGYAIFAVASCVSLIYLLQDQQLKTKRRSDLRRRLPSLETLDELNYRFVTWGFTLFTVGIITGSVLARERWGAFWSWEPVQLCSLITWLLYAVLLHTRLVGWRGRRAATLTIVGFALLIVSFLSVNLLFTGRHSALG